MSEQNRLPSYARGSAPDIAARLKQAIDTNQTTRMVLDEGLATLLNALKLHLDQQDAHLQQLIADLEGRARTDA